MSGLLETAKLAFRALNEAHSFIETFKDTSDDEMGNEAINDLLDKISSATVGLSLHLHGDTEIEP